jgi:feruloyl esterase
VAALVLTQTQGVGTGYGFAALSSSLGHNSTPLDGIWAYNAPEKVTNRGYRALHGSIVLGKELTRSYYGKDLAYSYYCGCSTGGRQGLKEAEMFPDDFDGIRSRGAGVVDYAFTVMKHEG